MVRMTGWSKEDRNEGERDTLPTRLTAKETVNQKMMKD